MKPLVLQHAYKVNVLIGKIDRHAGALPYYILCWRVNLPEQGRLEGRQIQWKGFDVQAH